jgi:hypothetical protein
MSSGSFSIFRLITLILFSSFDLSYTFAQTINEKVDVKWGEITKNKQGSFKSIPHNTADKIYIIVVKTSTPWIQVWSKDLNLIHEHELPLKVDGNWHEWEDLIFLRDKVILFTSTYVKSEKKTTLFARSYSVSDLSVHKQLNQLISVSGDPRKDKKVFRIEADSDSSGFKVSATAPLQDEQMSIVSEVKHYSADIALLREWQEQRERPYPADRYEEQVSLVQSDGTRYEVIRKYLDKEMDEKLNVSGNSKYDTFLLIYENGVGKPMTYRMNSDGQYLNDIRFITNSKRNEIMCIGFYSNKSPKGAKGAYLMAINTTTHEVQSTQLIEFDTEFMTSYVREKGTPLSRKTEIANSGDELYDYELRNIVFRDDGGIYLIGEQCFTDATMLHGVGNTSGMGQRMANEYTFNDIMVVSIDPNGDIDWSLKIPKRQRRNIYMDYFTSFAMAINGSDLYFLFYDHRNNLDLSEGGTVEPSDYTGDDAIVSMVSLDVSGRWHREELMKVEWPAPTLAPSWCVQLMDGQLFLVSQHSLWRRYGTITFK